MQLSFCDQAWLWCACRSYACNAKACVCCATHQLCTVLWHWAPPSSVSVIPFVTKHTKQLRGGHSDPACNTKLRSGQVKRCSCDICFMCVDTSVCACNRSAFRLLGLGMGVWTLAAAGCGASWNFGSLMFFRAFVGVGEASFVALAAPFIGGSCKILCGSERCDVARMCGLLHVAFATFRLKHAFPTATSR